MNWIPMMVASKKLEEAQNRYVGHLFVGLMAACFGLDFFTVWASRNAPEALETFACSVWPYVVLGRPFVSSALFTYAIGQCHGQIQEQAVSIIFCTLKMTLAIVSALLAFAIAFAQRRGFLRGRYEYSLSLRDKRGALLSQLVGTGVFFFCCAAAAYALLLPMVISGEPSQISNKAYPAGALYEDCATIFVFIAAVVLMAQSTVILSYAVYHRKKNPPETKT